VRINSINPAYELGCPEAEVANYLEEYFRRRSIETWQQEVFPGRPNLIARLPGRDASRRLIFEAHTDTVGIGGMTIPPFDPVVSDGRMYGRGSCDTKAGLAAMAYAAVSLKRDGLLPPCEVWVVAAVDEEHAFGGVRRLLPGLQAAAAVVSEPTQMRVATASKGVLRWEIQCHGKAAHSSKPHLGVNAIANMARAILALEEDSEKLRTVVHPLLGAATLSVGLIQGGQGINVVPELCTIHLDRRLLPAQEIPAVLDYYRGLLSSIPGISFLPPMLEDGAMETSCDSEIVQTALRTSRTLGLSHEPVGVPFGTDASKFSRAGIPSIICGPGNIDQAHAADEFIECIQVEQAAEFYRNLMLAFV
jgi:acetylornithine deacetylase